MRHEARRGTGSAGCKRLAAAALAALALACGGGAPQPDARPLRIALRGDPSSLDPHLQSEVVAQSVLGNVYETLVAFDVDMSLVPALAEQWEHPADTVVRFHLRDGVRFHDGRPLTAADVEFSLDRVRHHPRSRRSSHLVAIEEVRVLDERTLEIHTAHHYPLLLNKLAFLHVVPAGSPDEITEPVGSGPYRFVSFEPGTRLLLRAFDGYRAGPPPVSEIELVFLSDPQDRVRRLVAGEVDLIEEVPPGEVARLEALPGVRVHSRSGLSVTYLQMNPALAPFDDPRVRRALDLAVDREALVREDLLGHGRPVAQMVSPNVYGYAPDLVPAPPDPAEARRLLAEAGYGDGLELVLEHRSGRLTGLATLGSQLAAAGSHRELDRLIEETAAMEMGPRRAALERALTVLAAEHVFVPLYTAFDLYAGREELDWAPRRDGWVYAFEMRR